MIIGVAALGIASGAHAQQAVQWKVADGGNGHWYQLAGEAFLTQPEAAAFAANRGGAMISITSTDEYAFLANQNFDGCWLGGRRQDANPSNWEWLSGEPWSYATWANDPHYLSEPWLVLISSGRWCCGFGDTGPSLFWGAIEWSADCTGDGIVDYGQCHDGTLADYNSNNIPDCCERGEACVLENYPVQWRVADGGNGHWYAGISDNSGPEGITWQMARLRAISRGGDLASLETTNELVWVYDNIASSPRLWWFNSGETDGPYIGGFQDHSDPLYSEPSGGWNWLTGVRANVGAWGNGAPNNAGSQDFLHFWKPAAGISMTFDDVSDVDFGGSRSFLIEWSADCNHDGIVDEGQILQGQLADNDVDGIPDICQQPTCRDADLFRDLNVNGADLGILLSQWGPNSQFTVSDINKDGSVNGADLGLLLSFWGACP